MSHDDGQTCRCQAEHRPAPLELERHHIWPLGMGGPEDASNIVWVCPTTHTNTHEILRHLMRVGPLTWGEVLAMYDVPVSRYAYQLAVDGYRRWSAGSMVMWGAAS